MIHTFSIPGYNNQIPPKNEQGISHPPKAAKPPSNISITVPRSTRLIYSLVITTAVNPHHQWQQHYASPWATCMNGRHFQTPSQSRLHT